MDLNYLRGLLVGYIKTFGVFGVFAASFLEEIIVPIPSAAIMLASGALLLSEYNVIGKEFFLDFIQIVLWGTLGGSMGALIPYVVFYYGGEVALKKFGKFFGLDQSAPLKFIEKLRRLRYAGLYVLVLRSIPIVPNILLVSSCGIIKFSLWDFLVYFSFGGLIRNSLLVFLGWQAGASFLNKAEYIDGVSDLILKIICAVIVVAMLVFYIKRRELLS